MGGDTPKSVDSGAEVEDVDIDASVDVVEQIPADMVRVVVNHEVVATIPAPIGAEGPIPGSDFEIEAAGEPEAAMIAVKTDDVVAVRGADVRKMAVFERMVFMVALVGGIVVPVPVIVIHVRGMVGGTVDAMLFVAPVLLGLHFGRRRRDAALVGPRGTLM